MILKTINLGCWTDIANIRVPEGIRWLDVFLDQGSIKMSYLAPPNDFDKYVDISVGIYKEGMTVPGNSSFIARTQDLYVFQIGN